jgi:magnesium and cobalt transporter
LDEGTHGSLLATIRNLFRKSDSQLEEHLREAVEEGEIKSDDVRILQNVIDLEEKRVSEIMIPRPDIICAESDSSLEELADLIVQHGHSRIPVYEDNRDHIVGVVHAKDVIHPLLHQDATLPKLMELARSPHFVPETTNLKVLLHDMRTSRIHLAIVLDEYGGTAGLVTLEDVLEQIVGDIGDEYDELRPEEVQEQPDGSLLVSGRVPLDEVNELFDLELASDQVETIGGYLCEIAGRIPAQGETFALDGWTFHVEEADAKHIETLRARRSQEG